MNRIATQTFAELLSRHRQESGLTQEELAERTGLSVRNIAYLERDRTRTPRKQTVEHLAEALGLLGRDYAAFKLAARHLPDSSQGESAGTAAHTLPAPLTSFVGREREIEATGEMLPRKAVRLLTLTGAGGVGKTRLALEVARRTADHFPDGVWFIDLSPIVDPGLVLPAIARCLGLAEVPGRPILEVLKLRLQDAQALLVLDNFEQVVLAAPQAVELIVVCPGLKVLVTSRVLLRVSGEHHLPVPPLQAPAPGEALDVESLQRYEAVRLFVERVSALDPEFVLTGENAHVVAEICRRLDGLPLALELAAARSTLLSLHEILSRLQHSLGLLTGGARDLPERQRTVRATIEWSHELLGEGERRLFQRLGVFAGGWTVDAAEAVCGEGEPGLVVLEALGTLVDSSLVRRDAREHTETRFWMLETVREYAVERLQESGEADVLGRRHADHYLMIAKAFVAEIDRGLVGQQREEWLSRLRIEYANLRAALDWYASRGEAELGLRLANALYPLWYEDGQMTHGRQLLEHALGIPGTASAYQRGKALRDFVWAMWQMGDKAAARAYLEAALTRDRQEGDEATMAYDLAHLAWTAFASREYERATVLAGESAALHRKVGNKHGLAHVLCTAGEGADELGDHERARANYDEALALARAMGDGYLTAHIIGLLGWTTQLGGDVGRATELYEESMALHLRLGGRRGIGEDLAWLGLVALQQGDYSLAVTRFEEFLALMRYVRREGSSMLLAFGLRALAWAACYAGDVPRATELYREALIMLQELRDENGIAASLEGLAGVAASLENPRDAARIFGAAEGLRVAIRKPADQVERLLMGRWLGSVREALGHEAFEEAHAEGRAMTKDEGVAYALRATELLPSD